ncbi:MAG: transketolase [Deltaproteobacteria bacterium]|nr:transketolase [Deltaproteobacteria bacterium]
MPHASPELIQKCVDTIRFLAADGVQQANSGHPGMPMGAADMAFVLWSRHLRFDPKEPRWPGRDRFVLSAGHGSMLLYSMLHLCGFDLSLDDLKGFRQLHSRTPGHPEFGHTPGVEVTSGPLGQGIANAVGMALGQAMLAARLGPGSPAADATVYAIAGDGCLMEGVSYEAASFAGHNKLGRLVVLHDDNGITIDGKTSISTTGLDMARVYEGLGWHVQAVDGRDHEGISRAIGAARADPRPSLIQVKTVIGYGAPRKQGTSGVHGAPLGDEELAAAKRNLGWPESPRFLVPDEVRAWYAALAAEKRAEADALRGKEREWRARNPEKAALLDAHRDRTVPADLQARLLQGAEGADATRKLSQAVLQKAAALVPALVGGSADLAESNLTDVKGAGHVGTGGFEGRNVHFGVREHAMGAIANGLAYEGSFLPFVGTFLVFSDYMRPPVRLAALSRLQTVFVWTHDSIFLGEDGPTHQPVEHLSSLRAIPGLHVVRPADGLETAMAWSHALTRRDGPTALVLTRQKIAPIARPAGFDPAAAARGAYLVEDAPGASLTVIATGSELATAQAALGLLRQKGIAARLVSAPCLACFEAQPAEVREALLPSSHRICAVEAARGTEWWRHVGRDGLVIGIEGFGASAPEKALAEAYGLTPQKVAERIERWLLV